MRLRQGVAHMNLKELLMLSKILELIRRADLCLSMKNFLDLAVLTTESKANWDFCKYKNDTTNEGQNKFQAATFVLRALVTMYTQNERPALASGLTVPPTQFM